MNTLRRRVIFSWKCLHPEETHIRDWTLERTEVLDTSALASLLRTKGCHLPKRNSTRCITKEAFAYRFLSKNDKAIVGQCCVSLCIVRSIFNTGHCIENYHSNLSDRNQTHQYIYAVIHYMSRL